MTFGGGAIRQLTIDGFRIGDDSDCYVIAEIGHNHQGDVERCKQLIRAAKECGANAVKLQKRDIRTLYTSQMYNKPYDNPNSFGASYGAHREALEFHRSEYVELQQFCKELEVTFFATAFDIPSAEFLADLDAPAYKIASGDLRSLPLIQHVARFGKPIILSTGGATMEDVERAVEAVLPLNAQLCLLQCTAAYPAEFEELNLRVISTYRKRFREIAIGLSSHDNGIAMAVAAYMLGARVIEKHFTLNRAWKGTDHAFSLEPTGLRKMVRDLRRTRVALGDGVKKVYPSEVVPITKMSKKLVAARDLPEGHVVQAADVAMRSPGNGLPPYHLQRILGRRLLAPLQSDDALTLEILAPPS